MDYNETMEKLIEKLETMNSWKGWKVQVKVLREGHRAKDPAESELIRNINAKYHNAGSDILKGNFFLIQFQQKDDEEKIWTSCFNLDYFCESIVNHGWETFDLTMDENVKLLEKYSNNTVANLLDSYDEIRNHLIIRPINYTDNRRILKDYVFHRIEDIALVLYVLAIDEREGDMHNVDCFKLPLEEVTETWGLDPEEVWKEALINTFLFAPPRMYTSAEDWHKPPFTKGAFMATDYQLDPIDPLFGTIVTTTSKINGAIAMFYPGVLEKIAELVKGSFYVVFTSIHEARIYLERTSSQTTIRKSFKRFLKMVHPGDIVTRRVFRYDANAKTFTAMDQ